jgi:hypothetical protein
VLTLEEVALVHAAALLEVQDTNQEFSSFMALECALEMGWRDVAEECQRNPVYPRSLLTRHVAAGVGPGGDEEQLSPCLSKMPWTRTSLGVPDTSRAALVWSALLPGEFAARLAAKSLMARYDGATCFENVLAGAIGWKRHLARQLP